MHDPAVRDEARAVHVAFAAKVADELAGVLVSGLEIKRYTFLPTLVIVGQPRKALPVTDMGGVIQRSLVASDQHQYQQHQEFPNSLPAKNCTAQM